MTVTDLIATLEGMDPDAEVRIATQPAWPFENTVYDIVEDQHGIVYIAQGNQIGYLPGSGVEALGW